MELIRLTIDGKGALMEKQMRRKARRWKLKRVKTTCPFCGTGCNFDLCVKDGRIVGVASNPDSVVNGRSLCIKGRFGWDFVYSDRRLKTPLIKRNGRFVPSSWDEALDIEIIDQCFSSGGPDNISRQAVINKLCIELFPECRTAEEALGMFFWKTADLEPLISHKELLYLRALGRMYYGCCDIEIENMEKVFEILHISEEKLHWPRKELIKEAKMAYWQQYNELTRDLSNLFLNASEIVMKKKAFRFLCG